MTGPAATPETTRPYDLIGAMLEHEVGALGEQETLELFQHLIDTGMAWTLQGHYGRTAAALIQSGRCSPAAPAPKGGA